jgi:hypothetical protein
MGGDVIDFMALRGKETFDIRVFAWCDILSAMALSRPTLFRYETNIEHLLTVDPEGPPPIAEDDDVGLEWMVGCPNVMIVLMARISALRDLNVSPEEKRVLAEAIEGSIRAWQARPSQTNNSFLKVVRMSAQEIWRHAMILFLYHVSFVFANTRPFFFADRGSLGDLQGWASPSSSQGCGPANH